MLLLCLKIIFFIITFKSLKLSNGIADDANMHEASGQFFVFTEKAYAKLAEK